MREVTMLLREGLGRERAQALFYRALAARAEEEGDRGTAERLYALLADEQHHVSRLSARLLELGATPGADPVAAPSIPEGAWDETARAREADEVAWYDRALSLVADPDTRAILTEIRASERHHRDELGGKWMPASSTDSDGG